MTPGEESASTLHARLVTAAAAWLRKQNCSIVLTEMTSAESETPDAIGWKGKRSLLLECKASRADFLADRRKFFRTHADYGIGRLRYFCAPKGMLKPAELPENWGLLEWDGDALRAAKQPVPFSKYNSVGEVAMLLSTLRRIGQSAPTGTSIRCYVYETKNRATLGVAVPLAAPQPN